MSEQINTSSESVVLKKQVLEFYQKNFPYYTKEESDQQHINDWMIDISQIIQERHPFMQAIFKEFIHPQLHYYCMEVEVPNSGLLKNNFPSIHLEREGNLAKYIAMITLAMEYIDSFGANHGKMDCEHVYVSKNEENGEVTLKLSNIRSQMLKREESENQSENDFQNLIKLIIELKRYQFKEQSGLTVQNYEQILLISMMDDERQFFERLLKFTDAKEILRDPYITRAIYKNFFEKIPQNTLNYEERKNSSGLMISQEVSQNFNEAHLSQSGIIKQIQRIFNQQSLNQFNQMQQNVQILKENNGKQRFKNLMHALTCNIPIQRNPFQNLDENCRLDKNYEKEKERFVQYKQIGDLIICFDSISNQFCININSDQGFKKQFTIKSLQDDYKMMYYKVHQLETENKQFLLLIKYQMYKKMTYLLGNSLSLIKFSLISDDKLDYSSLWKKENLDIDDFQIINSQLYMTLNSRFQIQVFSIYNPDQVKQVFQLKHDPINAVNAIPFSLLHVKDQLKIEIFTQKNRTIRFLINNYTSSGQVSLFFIDFNKKTSILSQHSRFTVKPLIQNDILNFGHQRIHSMTMITNSKIFPLVLLNIQTYFNCMLILFDVEKQLALQKIELYGSITHEPLQTFDQQIIILCDQNNKLYLYDLSKKGTISLKSSQILLQSQIKAQQNCFFRLCRRIDDEGVTQDYTIVTVAGDKDIKQVFFYH